MRTRGAAESTEFLGDSQPSCAIEGQARLLLTLLLLCIQLRIAIVPTANVTLVTCDWLLVLLTSYLRVLLVLVTQVASLLLLTGLPVHLLRHRLPRPPARRSSHRKPDGLLRTHAFRTTSAGASWAADSDERPQNL